MSDQNLKALVFDAYGTIYDVASVLARCEHHFPGHGQAISDLWRVKQLEYTWLRSLMERYENFELVTDAGLRHTCRALSLELTDAVREDLMNEYFKLAPYAEVPAALERLAARMSLRRQLALGKSRGREEYARRKSSNQRYRPEAEENDSTHFSTLQHGGGTPRHRLSHRWHVVGALVLTLHRDRR